MSRALLLARTTWSKKLTQDLVLAECLPALLDSEQAECPVHRSTPTRVRFHKFPAASETDAEPKLVALAHDSLKHLWLPELSALGNPIP